MPGPQSNPKDLTRRWAALRSRQSNFRNLWDDVDDLVIPFRKDSQASEESPGERKNLKIFDSTATWALTVSASAIQGTMAPSSIKWFSVGINDEQLMRPKANSVWFEQARDLMFAAINDSNFATEYNELFLDLLGYGTGVVHINERNMGGVEDEFRGLKFKAYQPSMTAIAENEDGIADTVYRLSEATVSQVVRLFGLSRVSPRMQKWWDDGKVDRIVKILHATFPRPDVRLSDVTLETTADQLPYASVWMEKDAKHILRESGTFMPQYAAPRWFKASNEEYGRSPAVNQMPDIKSLNRIVQLELEAASLAVHPPVMVVDRGVIGTLRLVPGGVNSVRNRESIVPFNSGADFGVTNLVKEDLQLAIQRAFYIDQIQLPPVQGTPLTATEVASRLEIMQRVLGPTFGRVQRELLAVTLQRVFFLMARRGAFPPAPPALDEALTLRPTSLSFKFEGPLARAQQASDVEAIQRAIAILAPLQPQFPEIMDHFNATKAGKFVLDALNVAAEVVDSDEEVAQKNQARAQENAEAQAQQSGLAVTEGLKNVAPLLGQV